MAAEMIPLYLRSKDKLDEGLRFIAELPIDPRRKKETLCQYCRMIGAAITREYVERVLGDEADRV
jgi:hypothetical protein